MSFDLDFNLKEKSLSFIWYEFEKFMNSVINSVKTTCDQKYEIDLKDKLDYFPVVQSTSDYDIEAH